MTWRALGKKQTENNDYWREVWLHIAEIVPRAQLDALVSRTVAEVQHVTRGQRAAYAWSGGKDSQALRGIMDLTGIRPCVMGLTNLEFPTFLQWVTDTMPPDLELVNADLDLPWLAQHPEMLFPRDARTAAQWFKLVQHAAQAHYYNRHRLDLIILGRRRADGNYMGAAGQNSYTSKGITRYSPLKDWRHEDVLAFCHYYGYPLAPIYTWPNGFVVGTGAWAARQWTQTTAQGWYKTWLIDPDIVRQAADYLPSARQFLRDVERDNVRPVRLYRHTAGYWIG
ncbi:MAG: hypothetical protein JXA21_07005 [Anaerolineae bacterium]|nr:hypothetical protein [Anaerolineae bacterium]